jgi:hypothetical protein
MHHPIRSRWYALGLVAAWAATTPVLLAADPGAAKPAAKDSIFQPGDFTSLGKLVVAKGLTVTFNTGSKDTEPEVSGALTAKGAMGVSKGGKVQLAVFSFDSIVLAEDTQIIVKGDRGLALLSKDTILLETTLSVAGAAGAKMVRGPQVAASGGPGGEGGLYAKTLDSAPPPADRGNGGPPAKDNGFPGQGFGAGLNYRCQGGTAGSGAGYGGAGGDTSEGSGEGGHNHGKNQPMPGGPAYGDAPLAELFGGSGGAGGSNDRGYDNAGGGGGGGAISLVALRGITIGSKGRILATGGAGGVARACGGGGSGGGILLAAPSIVLNDEAQVDARGGDGGDGGPAVEAEIKKGAGRRNTGSGGGGGGGRIAFYSSQDFGTAGKNQIEKTPPKGINVSGGKGGTAAKDGEAGTFYDGSLPALR